ncbi:MAG: cardiolipin synthase ClsB [Burkholderiales bacterium]
MTSIQPEMESVDWPVPRWYQARQPQWIGDHQLSLLENGAEYFMALQQAIAQAREDIWFETYIFHDDLISRQVAEALIAASQRGVAVQLLIDGFGSAEVLVQLQQWFAGTPVEFRVFQPLTHWRHWLTRNKLRRLHRKMVVIDQRLGFIGGINILDDYHDPNHGPLEFPRLDFAVRLQGPLVQRMLQTMHQLWWRSQRQDRESIELGATEVTRSLQKIYQTYRQLTAARSAPEKISRAPVRAALALRDNVRQRRSIEKSYLQAIAHARYEIILANAYFFPGARFRRALCHAAQRGVKVSLLLQGRVEYPLQHYATQAMYDEMLNAGIRIFEYQKSFLHAKVGVIDDHWSTVGSSNIDPFSLLLAYEANLVILDSDFSRQLKTCLQQAIQDSRELTPSEHAQRSRMIRLFNRLAMLLLRFGVSLSGEARRY